VASYELGTGYLLGDPLARQSAGILVRLADETGGMASIGVLDGADAMVSRAQLPTRSSRQAESGTRYPAHLTALGWALLIDRSRTELAVLFGDRPLARPAGVGPATIDELARGLASAAERGYTMSVEGGPELGPSVAAPVRSAAGRVVAALTTSVPGPSPDSESRERRIDAVMAAASELSTRLGHRADPARG
jgi:DNA-binding IclR family transcriptional regulator